VVVTGGDADAAKTRSLHDRGGCDAAIALKPGADQFLIGVIRRSVGPTIHSGFSFAMPQTGDLILAGDSGLRMRANYSWSKGASRPISDRLLEQAQQNGTSHWQNRSWVFPETSGLWINL
jgi:hypothetical protein